MRMSYLSAAHFSAALALGACLLASPIAANAQMMSMRGDYQPPRVERADPRLPSKEFMRTQVRFDTRERPGTIIVDTATKYLYLVEADGMATRYGVGVGRDGFGWSGTVSVGRKAEWPGWTPPASMRAREAAQGRILPAYMAGGPDNPLGARALYLYRGGRDTIYRIHGTNQPWTIGQNMSSGCIRMMNDDVTDLYARVGTGTKVIVTASAAGALYSDLGPQKRGFFGG
jgi:lipoprotein-anchoring transpeptidase ErfK/SrfK